MDVPFGWIIRDVCVYFILCLVRCTIIISRAFHSTHIRCRRLLFSMKEYIIQLYTIFYICLGSLVLFIETRITPHQMNDTPIISWMNGWRPGRSEKKNCFFVKVPPTLPTASIFSTTDFRKKGTVLWNSAWPVFRMNNKVQRWADLVKYFFFRGRLCVERVTQVNKNIRWCNYTHLFKRREWNMKPTHNENFCFFQ